MKTSFKNVIKKIGAPLKSLDDAIGNGIAPRMRTRIFKVVLAVACFLIVSIFFAVANTQRETLDAGRIRKNLLEKASIIDLQNWEVTLLNCTSPSPSNRECSLNRKLNLSFPLISTSKMGAEIASFAESAPYETLARAVLKFDESQMAWLQKKDFVTLVIPRNLQVQTRVVLPPGAGESRGVGAHSSFTFPAAKLRQEGFLELEFDFTGYSFFGPMDLPLVLAEVDTAPLYQSLPIRQLASNDLVTQLGIAFRLNIAAMALVLDHSVQFGLLSLYGVARGIRALAPFLVEHGTAQSNLLKMIFYVSCALTCSALIAFVLEINGKSIRSFLFHFGLTAGSIAFFVTLGTLDPLSWIRLDLWSDLIGCLVSIPIVLYSIYSVFKKHAEMSKTPLKAQKLFSLKEGVGLVVTRKILILSALILHFYGNFEDILNQSKGGLKSVLDWKHAVLFPALTIAALFEVGFTSKKVKSVADEMVKKAIMDKELKEGREVQLDTLPPRKGSFAGWKWRAFYRPLSKVAGDSFDIQTLTLPNGQILIAALVIDITGHGVKAAMATGVGTCLFRTWSHQLLKNANFVTTKEARENALCELFQSINTGFLSINKSGSGTAICMLLEPLSGEISYLSAGHPMPLVGNSQNVRFLKKTQGSLLGISVSGSWQAESDILAQGETISLFTDGVVPAELGYSRWSRHLVREAKLKPMPIFTRLLLGARMNNRLRWEVENADCDDMTVVSFESDPHAPEAAQAS
jgi:hypothetical protein